MNINVRPGFKYQTSKWDGGLIDLYEVLWDDMKKTKKTILEVGVQSGESLRYWFDIVIDDGQHHVPETENTFNVFWDFVLPGGWYVIEDCGCDPMPNLIRNLMKRIYDSKQGKVLAISGIFHYEWEGLSPTALFKKDPTYIGRL